MVLVLVDWHEKIVISAKKAKQDDILIILIIVAILYRINL